MSMFMPIASSFARMVGLLESTFAHSPVERSDTTRGTMFLCLPANPAPSAMAHHSRIGFCRPLSRAYAGSLLVCVTATSRWSTLAAALTDGLPAVEAACAEALAGGVHSADVILNVLARQRDPGPPITIVPPPAFALQHAPVADCSRYDRLRSSN